MSTPASVALADHHWSAPRFADLDVALLDWPADRDLRHHLLSQGTPCLFLLDPATPPPATLTPLEDWIRLPADPTEVRARATALRLRARQTKPPVDEMVSVDGFGILRLGFTEVVLSPVEARLAEALLEQLGELVPKAELVHAIWPTGAPRDPRALDSCVARLRRRISPLPLVLHTVRGKGYLLDRAISDPLA